MPDLSPHDHLVLSAVRLATLTYHSALTPEEAVQYAVDAVLPETDGRRAAEFTDLAGKLVFHFTDPERLAVERIRDAIRNLTGPRRTLAAYRANAGVLTPVDVERLAK